MYTFAVDLTKSSPDLYIINESHIVRQLVEPLLLVEALDLREDDFDGIVLWRVSRVENWHDAQLPVSLHDFGGLVDSQVVYKEVKLVLAQFFSEFSKPAYVLVGVDSFLSHLKMLYLAVRRDGRQG